MRSILLIDDDRSLLSELETRLASHLRDDEYDIRKWTPTKADLDPLSTFEGHVDKETVLVVTDYDLTSKGRTGLYGSTIVDWCQERAIPVGDYSRGQHKGLPTQPDLFEFRIPTDPTRDGLFIASVAQGFKIIRECLMNDDSLRMKRSPAAVLASILGSPAVESQFALYGVRLGTSNAALVDKLLRTAPADKSPTDDEKRDLLTYIVGHLLFNAVLRFPGPILSTRALAAYVACDEHEAKTVADCFNEARYEGPFSEIDRYFWLTKVDEVLETMSASQQGSDEETEGGLNRRTLEAKIGRKLKSHKCERCNGANGGFLCPFTQRTVCQRADCSVGSNSWIPQGARICRIERDFYDEWSPILGL